MPELPEVESICRQLRSALGFASTRPITTCGQQLQPDNEQIAASLWLPTADIPMELVPPQFAYTIVKTTVINPRLRYPLTTDSLSPLQGQQLVSIKRRSRYLLFSFSNQLTLLLHLGMTGQLYLLSDLQHYQTKHNIFLLELNDGKGLLYRDIRRFGFLELYPTATLGTNHFLAHLGVEPLTQAFTPDYLQTQLQHTNRPIKTAIMDNDIVVGVGNIYANEALFHSAILPTRPANSLSLAELTTLVQQIKTILQASIAAQGTTFSDYRDSTGHKGKFAQSLAVYGHAQTLCPRCHQAQIQRHVLGGRSCFYCPHCQH